jgi:hypothetical protein
MSGVDTVYHCHRSFGLFVCLFYTLSQEFFGCVAHCSISKQTKERKKERKLIPRIKRERKNQKKKVHIFLFNIKYVFINKDRNLNNNCCS